MPSYQSVSAVLEDTARVPAKQPDGVRRMSRRETDTAVESPDVLQELPADDEETERNKKRGPAHTLTAPKPAGGFGGPDELPDQTAALPSIADATGSTTPYESHAELAARASSAALRAAGIAPRKFPQGRPGATARALHEEDEDGPTMVAPIPPEVANHVPRRPGAPPPDDEATQVHPFRLPAQPVTQPPPPMAAGAPPPSLPSHSQPSISIPSQREPIPTAPPPVVTSPHHANAAVQAAIDAAAMMSVEGKMLEDRKSRSYDTLAASSLGVGMITASLASYLAARSTEQSPSYFGIVALTTIAMFVIGLGPLQPRNETKLSFIALGGVMLGFTLLGLLIVALS